MLREINSGSHISNSNSSLHHPYIGAAQTICWGSVGHFTLILLLIPATLPQV